MTTRQEAVRARYAMPGERYGELFVARITAPSGRPTTGDAASCLAAQVFVMRHGRNVDDPLNSQRQVEAWLTSGNTVTYVANHERDLRLTGCRGYMVVDHDSTSRDPTDRFTVRESAVRYESDGRDRQTIIFGSMVRTMLEDNMLGGPAVGDLGGWNLLFVEPPANLRPGAAIAMSLQRAENGLTGNAGEVYLAIGRTGLTPVPI